eukprot:TRINITY_DN5344_c0_g1_i5.p1 TRINITY_DN5344_c0_g1~~TRINITY_DN5344_c0_g1_i5.p1  ORF type:complete len:308 (-),score=136.97 TRINITY_DN5344_c0_g1_i5:26-949(-)
MDPQKQQHELEIEDVKYTVESGEDLDFENSASASEEEDGEGGEGEKEEGSENQKDSSEEWEDPEALDEKVRAGKQNQERELAANGHKRSNQEREDEEEEEEEEDEEEEEEEQEERVRINGGRNKKQKLNEQYQQGGEEESGNQKENNNNNNNQAKKFGGEGGGVNSGFYAGLVPSSPDRCYINEFHDDWFGDYNRLEREHGFIQWLFPVFENSGVNWDATALSKSEAKLIRSNFEMSIRVIRSYRLMLNFYGLKLLNEETGQVARHEVIWKERFNNLQRNGHNNLRINRRNNNAGLDKSRVIGMRAM